MPATSAITSRVSYRWVAMGVALLGAFMVVLDTTVVNLALPALQRGFHTRDGVEWVVTGYLAAVGVAQMTSGWIADRFGRKRSFVVSLALFTIGSTLCAAAPSLSTLVVARVLQGFGGGTLMPVTMAMIYELFAPEERGFALGIWGIAVMAAPAIGPVLGGTIVSEVGWRWLFLINVPIGAIGVPIAIRLLRETGFRERRAFDGVGLVLSSLGIVGLLVGLDRGGTHGWSNPDVVVLLAAGAVFLVAFGVHALHRTHPLLDLRIYANRVFALSMVVVTLVTIAQYSRLVYIPLELGTTRPISELRIGFTMLPSALGIASTMALGGRLSDRIGSKVPVVIGASLLAASFVPLSRLTPTTPLLVVAGALFVGGLGAGLAMMPPNIVAMNSVSATKVSQATALSQVTRQISAAIGVAALASVLNSLEPNVLTAPGALAKSVDAFNAVFTVTIVVLLVAVAFGFTLPGKRKALELQADRREELGVLESIGQLDVETEGGLITEVL